MEFTNLNDFVFSYSSVGAYKQCPLSFKKNYIDKEEKVGNWFGQIGSLSHLVFEEWLKGSIEVFELEPFFKDNYDKNVNIRPPAYPKGMEENYKTQIADFFKNTDFNPYDWEIVCLESRHEYNLDGIKIVIKPDAVLKNKQTGKVHLLDYKTSKYDAKKQKGYAAQTCLYAKILHLAENITVDKIDIWYIRENKLKEVEYDEQIAQETLTDFKNMVELIRNENDWKAKPDKYFCFELCSVRNSCLEKRRI